MKEKIAVKSGYYFALVLAEQLQDVALEDTLKRVSVPNECGTFALFRGVAIGDVRKIDSLIDGNNIPFYRISECEVPNGDDEEEKVWEVTFARTGVAYIKCKKSEVAVLAEKIPEDSITWTDDWSVTDVMLSDD